MEQLQPGNAPGTDEPRNTVLEVDWAAVRFPTPARERPVRGVVRCNRPVVVEVDMINGLSIDALGVYCVLSRWHTEYEAISLSRLADERLDGDIERAERIVGELDAFGLIISPEVADALDRQAAEEERDRLERRAAELHPKPDYGDQSWSGPWPLLPDTVCPPKGTPVVYFLYDAFGGLAYVGSSENFRSRLQSHQSTKSWTHWTARDCATRYDAYQREWWEIHERRPYLNARDGLSGGDL